jgi:hypothetical protein
MPSNAVPVIASSGLQKWSLIGAFAAGGQKSQPHFITWCERHALTAVPFNASALVKDNSAATRHAGQQNARKTAGDTNRLHPGPLEKKLPQDWGTVAGYPEHDTWNLMLWGEACPGQAAVVLQCECTKKSKLWQHVCLTH